MGGGVALASSILTDTGWYTNSSLPGFILDDLVDKREGIAVRPSSKIRSLTALEIV